MLSIKTKVFGLVIVPLVLIVISVGVIVASLSIQNNKENLVVFEKAVYDDKKEFIKNEILTMSTIIDGIVKDSESIEDAKAKIIKIASSARFLNGSGYFFAYEKKASDYYFAFHGTKARLNGKKTNIMKPDIKGNVFRKALIDTRSDDNKFVEYYYQKPKTDKILKKVAFSKYIPALNWTLVTGVYTDDINKKIQKLEEINTSNTYSLLTTIFIMVAILLLIAVVVISYLSNKILLKPLKSLEEGLLGFFKYLNNETDKVTHIDVYSSDEIGKMSKIINNNIDNTTELLKEDRHFIEEVQNVMSKVEKGSFDSMINITTKNQSLNHLKETINLALNNLQDRLNSINTVLQEYSNYKYTNKLSIDGIEKEGSFDKLIININLLRDSINEMLVENTRNGIMLHDSAGNLLENISTLSKASTEAATSIEETAAALEQITSNITSNTENVVKMSGYANELTTSSTQGEKLAQQTTVSMDEINEQVSAINEAITVIDQIAFQTNILSLNAAVEAATAGEAGKGFAVVAGEVRNLAARSAEAASEIKNLVENATAKANNGKDIADKMITGYNGLNENISKTLDLIKSVELSSKEQQSGIMQINDAVNSLDRQTQQNANAANESQSIANTTSAIADKIVENAEQKDFIGKGDVDRRKKPIDISYSGNEKRKIEKKVRALNGDDVKPRTIISKPVTNTTSKQKTITSNLQNDEWESF